MASLLSTAPSLALQHSFKFSSEPSLQCGTSELPVAKRSIEPEHLYDLSIHYFLSAHIH